MQSDHSPRSEALEAVHSACSSKTKWEVQIYEETGSSPARVHADSRRRRGHGRTERNRDAVFLLEGKAACRRQGSLRSQVSGHRDGYYQAGTGKIKTKIATEQQAGQVAADLLWVGDASDYLTFKEQGILEAYVSPESEKVPAAYKDEDDLYCGARLVVMGMATTPRT